VKPPRALVTDAEVRGTVAACRTLREAGYEVDSVAASSPAASHWSRSTSRRLMAPDPREDRQAFAKAIAELLRAGGYDVLLPGSDAALFSLSEHRDLLGEVRAGLPAHDVVLRSLSKRGQVEAAEAAGLPQPKTASAETADEAGRTAAEIGYPVVVKPSTTVVPDGPGLRQRSSRLAADSRELEEVVSDFGPPVLIQERVQGDVFSLAAVRAGDLLLAPVFSRYERTWPPEAGNVSCSETVEVPPELERGAGDLIGALGWEGIFELELLRLPDGRFAPIDLNPRIYGSLELAGRAGAPLAAIWCDWLLQRPPSQAQVRLGVRYRWEDAEARNLWRRIRSGQVREALGMIRPRAGTVHAHFRLDDPGPFFARTIAALRSRARRRGDGAA